MWNPLKRAEWNNCPRMSTMTVETLSKGDLSSWTALTLSSTLSSRSVLSIRLLLVSSLSSTMSRANHHNTSSPSNKQLLTSSSRSSSIISNNNYKKTNYFRRTMIFIKIIVRIKMTFKIIKMISKINKTTFRITKVQLDCRTNQNIK